jgi:hypothetical protein
MKRCIFLRFHYEFIVKYVNTSGGTTYLVSLAQRKNMSSFKAGEIVAKTSPCNATPTVAISDACREIRRLRSRSGERKMNDYVTYVWCMSIIGRVLSPEWHI